MATIPTIQIITANDLLSGEVVYLAENGEWTIEHAEAISFETELGASSRLDDVMQLDPSVIGAYLVDVSLGEGNAPKPAHFRETFRTTGPSNRFIGKQAATSINGRELQNV